MIRERKVMEREGQGFVWKKWETYARRLWKFPDGLGNSFTPSFLSYCFYV